MQMRLESPKIWLASEPVDFRRSINGLCLWVSEEMQANPQEGIFIFYNKGRDRVKLLAWHRNGFVLIYKRLERGRFKIPRDFSNTFSLDERQLSWLLAGLDWHEMSHWDTLTFESYV